MVPSRRISKLNGIFFFSWEAVRICQNGVQEEAYLKSALMDMEVEGKGVNGYCSCCGTSIC